MEQILVNSSISIHSIAVLGICIFTFLFLHMLISTYVAKGEIEDMKDAKKMIAEGHERAMNGRKDDGLYEETKKLREGVVEMQEDYNDSDKKEVQEETEDEE